MATLGVVGAGLIGSGWAIRGLAYGLDVVAWDVAPNWQGRLETAVARAWPACARLGLAPDANPERLQFAESVELLCATADFIQESAPERLALKHAILEMLDGYAPAATPIASSTSGFRPTELQRACQRHPERVLVGHPFNPVYLLPLVEVVAGTGTDEAAAVRAMSFYAELGMRPLRIQREIDGHVADRLLEAVWREALHLVNDGIATTADIDAAITDGPGLRWAILGPFLGYHLGGGEAGMRHFLQQFGSTLDAPWARFDAPPLTPELADRIVQGTEEQAGGRSVAELERLRDDCLVSILEAASRYRQAVDAHT